MAWDDERYPGYPVARIFQRRGGNIGGGWFWTMPLVGKAGSRSNGPASGTVDDKDVAARLCEDAYFRFVEALR